MIAVKHTPVRAVVARDLSRERMQGAKMAVNVDPAQTGDAGKQILRDFTRGGGTLLTAPPGWKFPPQRPGQNQARRQGSGKDRQHLERSELDDGPPQPWGAAV
jgi:hypothetical protein